MTPSKPQPPSGRLLEARAVEGLVAAFERAGWRPIQAPGGPRAPDAVLQRAGRTLAVEVKTSAGKARRAVLRGRLADAVLQARAWAKRHGAEPFAVVVAPAISEGIAEDLASYMREVAPEVAWGLMDERGRFELHGNGLEDVRPVAPMTAAPEQEPNVSTPYNPFSDLGQWMLKVLLAERVPERWLGAQRVPVRGVTDLARAADVSFATASRFLAALLVGEHASKSTVGIQLTRLDDLLRDWRRSIPYSTERRFARFALPVKDPDEHLRAVLRKHYGKGLQNSAKASPTLHGPAGPRGQRACLGLFSACKSLGVSFVRSAPSHLISEDVSPAFLKKLELVLVDEQAPHDVIVIHPKFPESTFRGCVSDDGAPVADILQCWLDVSFHAARGAEQADEIARKLGFEEWTR
jgi:hypothetical protein